MFDEGCIHGCVLPLWGIINRVRFKGINYGFKLEIPDQMKLPKKHLDNTPLLALIAANVVPLFGAVFWDWNTLNIVFLYWAENLAVGFYTILKMVFFPVPDPAKRLSLGAFLVKTCFIVPFTIHYGLFTAVHGFLILMFFRLTLRDSHLFLMLPASL